MLGSPKKYEVAYRMAWKLHQACHSKPPSILDWNKRTRNELIMLWLAFRNLSWPSWHYDLVLDLGTLLEISLRIKSSLTVLTHYRMLGLRVIRNTMMRAFLLEIFKPLPIHTGTPHLVEQRKYYLLLVCSLAWRKVLVEESRPGKWVIRFGFGSN